MGKQPVLERRARWRIVVASLAALIVATEIAARLAFDFPLYEADDRIGYWLKPDQHGAFLFTKDWAFNGDRLGVAEEFKPSSKLDVLLVGDSIVYGGNSFEQGEKLGPLLEAATGWQVWPAAAGSWALKNQLEFLDSKPHLVDGADVVVFVLNSGDFGPPSEWRSEYTHPRRKPLFYLPYLFLRYFGESEPESPPSAVSQYDETAKAWAAFVGQADKPVVVVAYANRSEAGSHCEWVPAAFFAAGDWSCFDPSKLGGEPFADGIHLNPEAVPALARAVSAAVRSQLGEGPE